MAQEYTAGLVSKPFSYFEFANVMSLLNQGVNFDSIRKKATKEALFGVEREYRAVEIFNFVKKRAEVYDAEGIRLFCSSDATTAKAMTLAAVLKTDTLFSDFLFEIFREKLRLGELTLLYSDVVSFFERKRVESEAVASWTDATLQKLHSTYLAYLRDAGFIESAPGGKRGVYMIKRPLLSFEVEQYLSKHGMSKILYSMTGIR